MGILLTCAAITPVFAQNPAVTTDADIHLIESDSVGGMERALVAAGEKGFKVLAGGGLRLLLRRDAAPRAYRVIAARRDDTLIKELNGAGAQGFSVVREAVTTVGAEWILVLEKNPPGRTFSYTGVAGDGQVEGAVNAARKTGATIVALLGKAPGQARLAFGTNPPPLVVLERVEGEPPEAYSERNYRNVSTRRTGSLEKELQEAGSAGFRPIGAGFMNLVLERNPAEPERRREYRVVATRRASTALLEIEDLAKEGFRIAAMPNADNEWIFVLERDPNAPSRLIYLLAELRRDKLSSLIPSRSHRIVGVVEHVVVFEMDRP
jgi:hypothetical protein